MKANRKFLSADNDDAVSPVIAVILMVAITVVLAATVYVWVSGFGSQSNQPAKTVSMTSAMAIAGAVNPVDGTSNSTDYVKNYTIASATPGMKYSDVKITLDGATVACEDDLANNAHQWRVNRGGDFVGDWLECSNTQGIGPDAVVTAGDTVQLYYNGGALSGRTLRVLDSQANSVVLTLVVG